MIHVSTPVRKNWNTLRDPRRGVLLHYDDSSTDTGSLAWLTKDPTCAVSYNFLILRDGTVWQIAPLDARAWHAGVCEPSDPHRLTYRDANSAFYGVAIAANTSAPATSQQWASVLDVCLFLAGKEGWNLAHESWRITGHDREAFPRGRKVDPTGLNKLHPILSVDAVRAAFCPPPAALAA